MNEIVNETFDFISKVENPYFASPHVKLHHLKTGQFVNEIGDKKLLESFEHWISKWKICW